jgi:DNA-binding beta-propeller fold protein YncE
MAISPDQRFLFVTSTESPDPTKSTRMCNRTAQVNINYREGVVLVIDVERAKSAPKSAVISEVWAGCLPARLALSPDGNKLYVTAREDNELRIFDTRPIQTGGSPTLVGKMATGNAPVGVVAANGGKRIIVSNSNQFSSDAKRWDSLSVFDVQDGNDTYAMSGTILAGRDPRNLFLGADGRTLLVANRESGSLQIIDLARAIPALARPQAAQLAKPESCTQPLTDPVTNVRIGDNPWAIAATRDGCWIFLSVGGGAQAVGRKGVAVLHRTENKVDMVHFEAIAGGALGQVKLTHDEKVLILGASSQVVFMDVDKLKSGQQNSLLGSIRDQRFQGTANLAVTSDDQYVFVTQRDTAWVSVINLKEARETGYSSAAIKGGIPVGPTPVLLLSPDERYLYVFTTDTVSDWTKPPTCKASGALLKNREGAILVVDVERAKSNPAEAVIAIVEGSCRPGGVAISPDGNTLYETSLEDNVLLAFDTRAIRNGSSSFLIGKVPVAPVVGSVTLMDGGRRILVSSGNPFGGGLDGSKNQLLSVIDSATVSSGASAVVGRLDSGVAVTNFAITADGRSLITTERASGTVQVIDLERLQPQH